MAAPASVKQVEGHYANYVYDKCLVDGIWENKLIFSLLF